MQYGFRALVLSGLLITAAFLVFRNWQADAYQLPQISDYPAYFYDQSTPRALYKYHTGTRRVDSLALPVAPSQGITVSADGRLLYLATDSNIIVVAADGGATAAELPYAPHGPIVVSPDNRLVAVTGDSLVVLRLPDYHPVFVDTSTVRTGAFADNSRTLYCLGPEGSNWILTVALSDRSSETARITLSEGSPVQVVPDPDGERLFVQLEIQDLLDRVAVLDLRSNAEMYSEFIFPGDGGLARSPGWNRVVYTNSGRKGGPEGSSSFKIFDITANRPVEEVNTRRFVNDTIPVAFPVGPAVITPDHHWLIALDAPEGRQLLLYDLDREEFVDWIPLGDSCMVTSLAMQLRP